MLEISSTKMSIAFFSSTALSATRRASFINHRRDAVFLYIDERRRAPIRGYACLWKPGPGYARPRCPEPTRPRDKSGSGMRVLLDEFRVASCGAPSPADRARGRRHRAAKPATDPAPRPPGGLQK